MPPSPPKGKRFYTEHVAGDARADGSSNETSEESGSAREGKTGDVFKRGGFAGADLEPVDKGGGEECVSGDEGRSLEGHHVLQIDGGDLQRGEMLGEGVFGKVFQGFHKGEAVAIKIFNGLSSSYVGRADFEKEIRALRDVAGHDNIVSLVGVCDAYWVGNVPSPCIVTELVLGANLSDLLRSPCARSKGKDILLPGTHVCYIARGVASALSHMAGRGWAHCDVKSANILLSSGWAVKLCDFGLASRDFACRPAGIKAAVAGTPAWMAPEVLNGGAPNPKADVFALGVCVRACVLSVRVCVSA